MENITMYEVYKAAWTDLAARYAHEEDINRLSLVKLGREHCIALHRMERYRLQMDEVEEAMQQEAEKEKTIKRQSDDKNVLRTFMVYRLEITNEGEELLLLKRTQDHELAFKLADCLESFGVLPYIEEIRENGRRFRVR